MQLVTYNQMYIYADQSWTLYHDLMEEQSECCEGTYDGATEAILLQHDIEQARKSAEEAEKIMAQIEACGLVSERVCAQPLEIPV